MQLRGVLIWGGDGRTVSPWFSPLGRVTQVPVGSRLPRSTTRGRASGRGPGVVPDTSQGPEPVALQTAYEWPLYGPQSLWTSNHCLLAISAFCIASTVSTSGLLLRFPPRSPVGAGWAETFDPVPPPDWVLYFLVFVSMQPEDCGRV